MATKEIADFGQKIGGARKDLRGNVRLEDIREMTMEEMLELVTKNVVWPTPDYEEMVATQGYTQKAALMVKSLRDCFPAAPKCSATATDADRTRASEMYATLVNAAKAVAARGKTEAELAKAFNDAPEAKEWLADFSSAPNPSTYRGYGRDNYVPAKRYNEAIEAAFGRSCLSDSHFMIGSFRTFAAGSLDSTSNRILKKNPQWPAGTSQAEAFLRRSQIGVIPIGTDGFRIGRSGTLPVPHTYSHHELSRVGFDDATLAKLFKTKEEADAAMLVVAEAHYATKRSGAKAKREALLQRAKGAVVVGDGLVDRVGKNWRDGADVEGEDYLRVFGLRGGEFGLWVNQEERQMVLNKGFDSFHDLADVMALEPSHTSLGGTLSIAFGARGNGGWAAAHYEPGRRVFNLTKPSGEGCFCHEWFHALDHHLGRRATDLGLVERIRDPEHAPYLTNVTLKKKSPEAVESPEATYLREVHDAVDSIPVSNDPKTKAVLLTEAKKRYEENVRWLMIQVAAAENFLDRTTWIPQDKRAELSGLISRMRSPDPERKQEDFHSAVGSLVVAPELVRFPNRHVLSYYQTEMLKAAVSVRDSEQLPDGWTGEAVKRKTNYASAVAKLDKQRSSPYYSKQHEMFARVGEAVIADELVARGRANYFLVAGASGEAYPQAEERDGFRTKFMPLLKGLAGHLPKVVSEVGRRECPPLPQPRAAAVAFQGEQMTLI